jgi:hypothetical protein
MRVKIVDQQRTASSWARPYERAVERLRAINLSTNSRTTNTWRNCLDISSANGPLPTVHGLPVRVMSSLQVTGPQCVADQTRWVSTHRALAAPADRATDQVSVMSWPAESALVPSSLRDERTTAPRRALSRRSHSSCCSWPGRQPRAVGEPGGYGFRGRQGHCQGLSRNSVWSASIVQSTARLRARRARSSSANSSSARGETTVRAGRWMGVRLVVMSAESSLCRHPVAQAT